MMLSVGWLPQQPSHAFDDVATPVFDWVLVIVITAQAGKCVVPTPREPDYLAC
jgi:hypothetical protein